MLIRKNYVKMIEQNISIIHQWIIVGNNKINLAYLLNTLFEYSLHFKKDNDVGSSKKVIQENTRIFLDCLFHVPKTLIRTLWKIIFKIFLNEKIWKIYDTTDLLDNPGKSFKILDKCREIKVLWKTRQNRRKTCLNRPIMDQLERGSHAFR
jgi:hypothetical protein